jgi:hypothetical protein
LHYALSLGRSQVFTTLKNHLHKVVVLLDLIDESDVVEGVAMAKNTINFVNNLNVSSTVATDTILNAIELVQEFKNAGNITAMFLEMEQVISSDICVVLRRNQLE